MTDRMNRGAERGACARIVDRREPVMHPRSVSARVDETGAAQTGEVSRDRRLRKSQRTVDVADAHLTRCQETKDAEPCRVAQGAVHPRKFMNSRHEYVVANISRRW